MQRQTDNSISAAIDFATSGGLSGPFLTLQYRVFPG